MAGRGEEAQRRAAVPHAARGHRAGGHRVACISCSNTHLLGSGAGAWHGVPSDVLPYRVLLVRATALPAGTFPELPGVAPT